MKLATSYLVQSKHHSLDGDTNAGIDFAIENRLHDQI